MVTVTWGDGSAADARTIDRIEQQAPDLIATESVSHSYAATGFYAITVTAKDTFGAPVSTTVELEVRNPGEIPKEVRWVLTETRVLGGDLRVGTGRTEGSIYEVTIAEGTLTVHDKSVDNGFLYWTGRLRLRSTALASSSSRAR